ncbi:Pyridoxal-phosphate dependent enzyme, putative [Angomonas deanei]|uniref:Pyridoxal-phosphate dependent enzyme, putative n=1 Tax=Angomonas deanei TaxID=59799 RepID=A0A7G2CKD1_9TRYP|nr:Pyridoxal-phosphate dependent enzyme, putative [Angomonas deanei]
MPPSQLRVFCKARSLSYIDAAQMIIEQLIDRSMSPSELYPLLLRAYDGDRWNGTLDICPVTPLLQGAKGDKWAEDVSVMELFHGPTAAFKDFALQLFPQYFNAAAEAEYKEQQQSGKTDRDKYMILAATSGDTGVAAISGFVNAGGKTKVMILYPMQGVSPVQRLQMLSFDDGTNVRVYGVEHSNFDFCQNTVKVIFGDKPLNEKLAARPIPIKLSSANSINWGRLVPQVAYYFWAYRHQVQNPSAGWNYGDPLDVVVPCGNFGNILGAYVAKLMGLPLGKLIVASNVNDVLYEFVQTGKYDITSRHLAPTASPSIDILKASNVERFLYLLSDGDADLVALFMSQLEKNGCFEITEAMKHRMKESFWSFRCDEANCAKTIKEVYEASGKKRLLDPHTAVAVYVAKQYRETVALESELSQGGKPVAPLVIASTAHWAKFPEPVLHAIHGEEMQLSEPPSEVPAVVAHIRELYDQIVSEDVQVHPALSAMLTKALETASAARSVEPDRAEVQRQLEEFAEA